MLFLEFRRIMAGLMAAVMLVSAGAVAVAENKAMPAEFSGTYQFQEVGTLRDVADRVGGLMLKSIDDYIKSSGNKNPNVLSELIEVSLHNAETHNEVHRNRERTDLFYFNEDWFKGNAADGTPDLDMAIMSQQLSLAVCTNAETGADANALLEKLGFDNIRVYNSEDEGVDTDALGTRFVIAAKPLADGTTLVTVLPDISNTAPSWVDNLDVGSMDTDGIYHGGFSKAAKFAKDCLDEYVDGISGAVKYWITGYSRGGAISNLLSAFLTDDPLSGAEQKDVFAYTFSSPGTVELTESDTTHNNIHNYISKYDIVPALPPHMVSDGMNIDGTSSDDGLTFRRYGVDHIIQDVEGVEETDILEYIYAISPTIFEDYRMHGMATDFAEMEVVIPDTLNLELHGTIGTLTDAIVERMYGANPEDMAGIVSSIDTIAELFSRETAGLLKDFFEQIQDITAPEQIDEQKLNALMTSVHRVLTSLAEYDVSGLTREVENSPTQDQFIYDYDEKIQTAVIQVLTTLLDARDGMNEESKTNMENFRATLEHIVTQINDKEGIDISGEDYSEILNIDDAETYRDLYDKIYRLVELISKSMSEKAAEEGTDKMNAVLEAAFGLNNNLKETVHNVILQLADCKTDANGEKVFTNRAKQTQKDLTTSILIIYFASRLQKEENANEELVQYLKNVTVGNASDVRYADNDEEEYQYMNTSGCLSRILYSILRAAKIECPYTNESGETVYGEVNEEMSVEIAGKLFDSVLRLIKNNKLVIGDIFNPETESGSRRAAQFKALLNGALTVSHNIKRILYAHYPEVYLSWMRAGAATDENSFYYGGVVAPMGRVNDGGETEFALLGDAKYDAAVAMTGADGVTANVNYTSFDDAVTVSPGTIDISDINAVGSKTDTETLLSKDIDAGNVLKMEGNISVNKDTYLLENNLTSSELTMRAEGAFKMLFSYLLKGYAELKERAVTGTAANDDSSTDWKAYSVEVKSAKEEDESPSLRMLVDNATAVNTRVDSEANTIVTTRKMFVGSEELMNKTITEWNVTNSGSVSNYRVGYDNEGKVSNVCATLKLTIPEDINTLSFTRKNKTQQLAVTPAFGIKSVKVENDAIKSVELKGEPEPSAIYVAVYDSAAALKDVRRVDVTKETSYDFDLPLIQNGSYKILLWGTDMKPIGMME